MTVDKIVSEINKAQSYATDGKVISGSTVWGVCLTGNTFRMFNGTCAAPNYQEDHVIPGGVTLSGITSLTFDNLRGEPSSVSVISVMSTVGSNMVTINAAGMVDVN